jgi:hypothetical protein
VNRHWNRRAAFAAAVAGLCAAALVAPAAAQTGTNTTLAPVPRATGSHAAKIPPKTAARATPAGATGAPAPAADSGAVVTIFADGDVRGVLDQPAGGQKATGTGSLGFSSASRSGVYTGLIAVASTQDSIAANFGSALLAPATGRALKSALLDARLVSPRWLRRVHVYVSYASSLWSCSSCAPQTASATAIGVGGLLYRNLQDGNLGETPFQVTVEAGAALRWLAGDAGADSAFRAATLGTPTRAFVGLECGFQVVFGRATAAAQFYYLKDWAHQHHVQGLTDGQVAVGISIAAEFIRARLAPRAP